MLSSAGVESRSGRSRVTGPWRSTGRAGRHSSAVWTLSGLQCGRGCSGMQTEGRLRARLAVRCFVPRGARRAIESFVRAKRVVAADFSTNVTGEKRRMAVLSLRWYQNAGAGEPGSRGPSRRKNRREVNRRGSMISRGLGVGRVVRAQMARRRKASVTVGETSEGPKLRVGSGLGENFGGCLVWVQSEGNNIGC